MANATNEYVNTGSVVGPLPRVQPERVQPKTLSAGTGTLEVMTPMAFNSSTNEYVPWLGTTNEVNTITANATPATAGTFTLTVGGQTTAAIAFDATAAAVQAALEALSNVEVGDVAAVQTSGTDLGDSSAVVTLTWGGTLAGQDIAISITTSGLTGNAHVLATPTAGGANEANGTHLIKAFVYPNAVTLDATGSLVRPLLTAGVIDYRDIPIIVNQYSATELKAALRNVEFRKLGFTVQGLSAVG